jgi:hypothetical protein
VKIVIKDDLKRLRRELTATAQHIERANRSALASVGNVLRLALARYIRMGGEGWPRRHWLSRYMTVTDEREAIFRRRAGTDRPYLWLARFARYRVEDAAGQSVYGYGGAGRAAARVRAGFGKSNRLRGAAAAVGNWNRTRAATTAGGDRTFDAFLESVVHQAEHGERVRVTDKMRRHIGGLMRAERGKKAWTFRKSTHTVYIPRRPILSPVYRKSEGKIGAHYRSRFFAALERYQTGAKKSYDDKPGDIARGLLGME